MNINDQLPDFNLLGTDNQHHTPAEYRDKEAVAIIITCNHCPYARAYVSRISDMVAKYEGQGIGFFAINPNDTVNYPEDSFERMIPMAAQLNLEGKYLYDENQELAHAFSAMKTPEVYLFDKERKLVYQGAIDDNYEEPGNVQEKFLENAINSLLQNDPIRETETTPIGCSVKWKS